MPEFSEQSLKALSSCDQRLQKLFLEVVKHFDCTVICGFRDMAAQDAAFNGGMSKLAWPNSKHNHYPSTAIDAAPYPVVWEDEERFYYFAGFVKGVASQMGLSIRCGADWDGDMQVKDENFIDLDHFEIISDKQ